MCNNNYMYKHIWPIPLNLIDWYLRCSVLKCCLNKVKYVQPKCLTDILLFYHFTSVEFILCKIGDFSPFLSHLPVCHISRYFHLVYNYNLFPISISKGLTCKLKSNEGISFAKFCLVYKILLYFQCTCWPNKIW